MLKKVDINKKEKKTVLKGFRGKWQHHINKVIKKRRKRDDNNERNKFKFGRKY